MIVIDHDSIENSQIKLDDLLNIRFRSSSMR